MNNSVKCTIAGLITIITGGTYVGTHNAINQNQPIGNVYINGKYITTLKTTTKGLALIGNAEGCKLNPYKCPAGLLTNGVGNTHKVTSAQITQEQAAIDWVMNIKNAEICLDNSHNKTPFTYGQWDSLTSFIFNVGCTTFRLNKDGSFTQIYEYVSKGRYQLACGQLYRWTYSNGIKLDGLVVRRGDEYVRCNELD